MDNDREHSPQTAPGGPALPVDALEVLERRLALAEARIDSLVARLRDAGDGVGAARGEPAAEPAMDDGEAGDDGLEDDGPWDAGGPDPDRAGGDWDDAAERKRQTIPAAELGTAAEERRIRFRETAALTRLMERETNELRDQLAELQSRLATAEADNERLRARVLSGKEEMLRVKQRAKTAEAERASLMKSTSWKVTKPLRALNRTLRGR